ncbi:Forkhead associated (FHA) domain [Emericellopsis cladophorae]|uniref:Forkhead associated (FHA) domain n=1 Tax=Emericellopsis cladophorae TaxID=2686198 RepID=A0A9P9Y234_9HYPO|nr:Forkhead associated (FHA) domain [Emericellopsis cladophorae]KAI6782097.1 Forkhead associated (FHA) domain [Emericellopsis cladophorae]
MRPEHALESPRPIDLTEPTPPELSQPQQITATVQLTSTNAEDRLGPLGRRRIVLTPAKPTCPIGRASSKRPGLEASATNAYFESAVVSRCHGELQLDVQGRQIILKDKGSLHGTLHNDRLLKTKETRTLKSGDTITLGAPIERGHDKFQPYKVHTNIVWDVPYHADRPVTYTVPDDTDVEDNEDDCGDETDLDFAQSVLVENGFNPLSSPSRAAAASTLQSYSGGVVDLTEGQVAAAVQEVHKTTEPTSIDFEEPDLYSDDRVPVGVLPAETLWYSTIGDESSEDMPESSSAEEWGPRTSSGSGNELADVSAYESELDNDVGVHDLDDEQPLEEDFMDSDAASLMDDFGSDEATKWVDYGGTTTEVTAKAKAEEAKQTTTVDDEIPQELPTRDTEPTVEGMSADAEHQTASPKTPSRKRAADTISRSTAEEDEAMFKATEIAVQAEDVSKEPTTLAVESSYAISQTEPVNESSPVVQAVSTTKDQRPAKRVRRSVAEAAGYVALGGVLAWSALVATAPVL